MITFVMGKYTGLRKGMMRICESIRPSTKEVLVVWERDANRVCATERYL